MIKKFAFLSTILLFTGITTNAQMIAKVEMKQPVEGICDQNNVYGLFNGFKGQIEPTCSISKEAMQNILNEKLEFLKENPKFKSKGMVDVFINCEGKPLNWSISIASGNKDLDNKILDIFKTFGDWNAGKLNGKNVDSNEAISYKIKKGVLIIE